MARPVTQHVFIYRAPIARLSDPPPPARRLLTFSPSIRSGMSSSTLKPLAIVYRIMVRKAKPPGSYFLDVKQRQRLHSASGGKAR
jgi:hypothetical protein